MTFELNLYEILGIKEWQGRENDISDEEVKRAYRESLLLSHPDKKQQRNENHSSVTVEEIRRAFTILSDPISRKEYQTRLSNNGGGSTIGRGFVQLGDAIDLDEMIFHENVTDFNGLETLKWTKSCRCGDTQGYVVWEQDLIGNGSADEIKVPCMGCSLWITVQYSSIDE